MQLKLKHYYLTNMVLSLSSAPAEYVKYTIQVNSGLLNTGDSHNAMAVGFGLVTFPILVMLIHISLFTLMNNILSRKSTSIEMNSLRIKRDSWMTNIVRMAVIILILAVNVHYILTYHYPYWINLLYTLIYLSYGMGIVGILSKRKKIH